MGTLTRDTIVSEALELAGDTSLTNRANVWLNLFLRSEYRAWDWDFLKRQTVLTLASGAVSASMSLTRATMAKVLNVYAHRPAGTIGASLELRRKLTKAGLYAGLDSEKHPLLVRTSGESGAPEYWGFDSRTATGLIYVWPRADQAYSLDVEWVETPADPGASDLPTYPDDETMVQAVFVKALKHLQDERAGEEESKLEVMRQRVRGLERDASGTYATATLDPDVFRRGSWVR